MPFKGFLGPSWKMTSLTRILHRFAYYITFCPVIQVLNVKNEYVVYNQKRKTAPYA